MRDWTTIVGVDRRHADEWQLTWPTWRKHRPELLDRPLIVFYDATEPEADWRKRLDFLDHPNFKLHPWSLAGADQREKMLNGCVFVAARVETPWYLKLDVDVVAEPNEKWFDLSWFRPNRRRRNPVFIASPWGFTKPARWIDELECWSRDVPDLAGQPPLGLTVPEGAARLRHRRIISYCFFGDTAWTRQMAAYCPVRLPVPSQDTYLWYCAAKRGDFYRAVRMNALGWRHVSRRRLRAAAEKAMSLPTTPPADRSAELCAAPRSRLSVRRKSRLERGGSRLRGPAIAVDPRATVEDMLTASEPAGGIVQIITSSEGPLPNSIAPELEREPWEAEFEAVRIAKAKNFLRRRHNRNQVRTLAELVPENGVFVDVGGFVGNFTEYVTNVRHCRAILFEPVRGHFDFCRRRFASRPAVRVEHLALSDAAGESAIYRGHRNLQWNTMMADMRNARNSLLPPESVPSVAFDDYRRDKNIDRVDVVKIDVEGYEWRVLRGMRLTIEQFLPHLECELHFGTQHSQWKEQAAEFERLFSLGYRRFNLDTAFPRNSRRQNAIILLKSPKA